MPFGKLNESMENAIHDRTKTSNNPTLGRNFERLSGKPRNRWENVDCKITTNMRQVKLDTNYRVEQTSSFASPLFVFFSVIEFSRDSDSVPAHYTFHSFDMEIQTSGSSTNLLLLSLFLILQVRFLFTIRQDNSLSLSLFYPLYIFNHWKKDEYRRKQEPRSQVKAAPADSSTTIPLFNGMSVLDFAF